MQPFTRPSRRAAVIACTAGAAVVGALGFGAAAFADAAPTQGASQSSSERPGAPTPPAPGEQRGDRPGPRAHAPHIAGTVLTVSSTELTVEDRDGFTRTIHVAAGATVTDGDATSSISEVSKGEHVEATGTVATNGTTLNATAIRVGDPGPRGGGPAGRGGPASGERSKGHAGPEGAPAPPAGAPTAPGEGATSAPSGS